MWVPDKLLSSQGTSFLQQCTKRIRAVQVLQDLATGHIVADQQDNPALQEQLQQHILRPADVICALNFSIFLLSSR